MATNIRVTLEVDNKKYIADVRAADRATKEFANSTTANTNTVNNNFKKLGGSTDMLHRGFMRLKGVIAGGLFLGMAGSALKLADELADLSASTGVTIGQLIGLRDAIQEAGGAPDQMAAAINKFMLSIDDAAQGSLDAQLRFRDLGIGIRQLESLGEVDLMRNTLISIASITDKSRQAALMMEFFGKSFRTVDPSAMIAALDDASGKNDEMAASIQRSSELVGKFEKAWDNIRLAFLTAIEPILDWFSNFKMDADETKAFIEGLATAFKVLGAVIATVFVVTGIRTLVTAFLMVYRGVALLFTGLGRLKDAFNVTMAGKTPGAVMNLKDLFSALGVAVTVVTGFIAKFWDGLKEVGNWISSTFTAMLDGVASGIFGIASAFQAAKRFENPFDAYSKAVDAYKENLKTVRAEEARRAFAANDPRRVTPGAAPAGSATPTPAGDDKKRPVEDPLKERRESIRKATEEFKRQNEETLRSITLEGQLIGKREDDLAVIRAQEEVFAKARDKVAELTAARDGLSAKERDLVGVYNEQIAKIQQQAQVDADRIGAAVRANETLKLLEKERLADLDRITKAYEQQQRVAEAFANVQQGIRAAQQDVEFAGQQQGRSPFEQQIAEIKENARKAALEAGRAFAQAFEDSGDGLTPEQAQQFADGLAAIEAGYRGIAEAQLANLEASRTFSAGWQEAFKAYKDSAQNAAEQSRTYFETFSRGVEDAFVSFVRTGKLSFKDLANSLIADFARIQAKKALSGLFDMGGGGGGGFLSGIGKIFGFAGGGNPAIGVPAIVGENGPELFVPRNAGTIIPNNQAFGGGQTIQQVSYTINATDAQSFKALLARDPQFIHSVVEQGRRSTPQRSRR